MTPHPPTPAPELAKTMPCVPWCAPGNICEQCGGTGKVPAKAGAS